LEDGVLLRIERSPSTPEKVASRIRDLISSGAIPPGELLPPQLHLASRLEVSRSSVREALTSLEAGGFIQKLPNGRYRVTALSEGRLLPPLREVLRSEPYLIWDLMEVASVMVVEAARLAALRASPEQLERLEDCLRELEAASRNRRYFVREFNRIYMNFYESLALATGNVVYLHLGHAFMEILAQALPHTDKLFLVQEDINAELYHQHLAIFKAVASRDPRSATRAFRRHLAYIEEKLRLILGGAVLDDDASGGLTSGTEEKGYKGGHPRPQVAKKNARGGKAGTAVRAAAAAYGGKGGRAR